MVSIPGWHIVNYALSETKMVPKFDVSNKGEIIVTAGVKNTLTLFSQHRISMMIAIFLAAIHILALCKVTSGEQRIFKVNIKVKGLQFTGTFQNRIVKYPG